MQIKFNSKDALLAALRAKLPEVREYDKRLTAQHKAAEKAALEKFRGQLRGALKKSYSELVVTNRWGSEGRSVTLEMAKCPILAMPRAQQVIAAYELTQQDTFSLTDNGVHSEAYWLLTFDANPPAKTPCR